jgi:hypothetical protein
MGLTCSDMGVIPRFDNDYMFNVILVPALFLMYSEKGMFLVNISSGGSMKSSNGVMFALCKGPFGIMLYTRNPKCLLVEDEGEGESDSFAPIYVCI